MAQDFAKSFYRSQAWKNTRKAYLRSRGGLCERYLAKGLIVPATLVHHKVHLTPDNIEDESVTLNWDNLEALCRACHTEEHADIYIGRHFPKSRRIKKRYTIDDNGHVITKK